jgi:isopentenyl diphosphate isomerase/L-lactate dehydrogenase-like FMN-dependent dehydrogenase
LRYRSLGADAVLAGRPWEWALAAAGERGVAQLLAMFDSELRTAMSLTGQPKLQAKQPRAGNPNVERVVHG